MVKNIFKYLIVSFIALFLFSILLSKIIIENKFALKTNDLKGLEELTSKVFTFTNQGISKRIDHSKLVDGINLLPYFSFDNKLTEYSIFIYHTAMNYFKLDGYQCAGHSRYLQRLFEHYGIKSFSYNHGIENTRYTHVLVVAELNDNLYIFDPTHNYVYRDNEKYLTLKDVITLIYQKKDMKKFIKIIDEQSKVYHKDLKKNFTPTSSAVYDNFNRANHLFQNDKKHLLLNGFGMYAGTVPKDYFLKKYPYLNSLFQ